MACLHISRPPLLSLHPSILLSDVDFKDPGQLLRLRGRRIPKSPLTRRLRLCCQLDDGKAEGESNAEESPESLFMKELKRRGMMPTLLEDSNRSLYGAGENEMKLNKDSGDFTKRSGVVSAEYEQSLLKQRERSMVLNSEGLEGLIPRAKLLLTLGGTFFLAFGPLMLITITFFSVLYFYFGPNFVHDANKTPVVPPPYIDPYKLLEDETISQSAPHLK